MRLQASGDLLRRSGIDVKQQGSQMKLKSSLTALALASVTTVATATTIDPVAVTGAFTNLPLTTLMLPAAADVSGDILAGIGTVFFGSVPLTLSAVTLTGASLGGVPLTDADPLAPGFQFAAAQLLPGAYALVVSGFTTDGLALLAGAYEVSPVPEPQSAVLVLAGLGVVGLLALRRRRSDR